MHCRIDLHLDMPPEVWVGCNDAQKLSLHCLEAVMWAIYNVDERLEWVRLRRFLRLLYAQCCTEDGDSFEAYELLCEAFVSGQRCTLQ